MFAQRRSTNIFDYLQLHVKFIEDFIVWWYIDIPSYFWGVIRRLNTVVIDTTSFATVLKGFFRPWKNDYNIAGWVVGMILKILYIPVILFILLVLNVILFSLLIVQLTLLPLIIAMIIINPFIAA